ncbi:MAG: hypothetical protein ABI203_08765, partial [Mucilaginibacter sp.]
KDFDLRSRAISSLLLKNYNHALTDFILINESENNNNETSDGTYMYIGLCYYALGDMERATDYFKYPLTNGKEIKYTSDISVPPSVLLFIGTKLEKQDIINLAIKVLKRLSKFKTAAPNYLLEIRSETELDKEFQQYSNPTMRNRWQCKVEFYKAIHYLQNGSQKKYENHIKNCVALTGKYLEFEYFIAKVEYDKFSGNVNPVKKNFFDIRHWFNK